MAGVCFSIASKPCLSADEANDLAELLTLGRNLAAVKLASRIRYQALLDPDRGDVSTDIDLSRDELEQIASVFVDGPDLLLAVPAYAHLNVEVLLELAQPHGPG